MDADILAEHLASGRFAAAADLVVSYTVPTVTERATELVVHDLAADAGEIVAGTFQPVGSRVMIDVESAFSIVGTSRGELFLYVGQPDVPGARLFDCGGKPLEGVSLHSTGALCGDMPWASTTSRRIVVDVDPTKPVTWQVLAGILGPSAVTTVEGPARVAITPDGTTAFVTSPATGSVTPVRLGRPMYSYDRTVRPDDVGRPPVATGAGALDVATNDEQAVVVNVDDGGGSISVVDVATLTVVRTIPVEGAIAVALTPGGDRAVVATTTGEVGVVDLASGATRLAPVPGSGALRSVAALDATTALVADPDTGTVHCIDLDRLAVTASVEVGATPWVVRVAPDGVPWVVCRDGGAKGRICRIDPSAGGQVTESHELPYPNPNDLAFVSVAGQTDELVRTAWTVYETGYSEFYVGGEFTGQAHTWHTGAFPGDALGPTGVAVNDYGEIWVVRPSQDHVFKWPGGRFSIRPGLLFGEYCTVSVYGAAPPVSP